MNRKYFISSLITTGAALSAPPLRAASPIDEPPTQPVIPSYLKPGDTIGITSPAGFMSLLEIQPAIQQMESWGFKIAIGSTIGKKDFTYGGTDTERAADLQQMMDNPNIKAIMCARGGYGVVRIIDRLNFTRFVKQPKWIIGFSDITVLLCHINRNFNIATIHSKMCNSFPTDWAKAEPEQVTSILAIRKALTGEALSYEAQAANFNRAGKANGQLVGGNLTTLTNLAGTASDLITKDKILFLEDTDEYLYSIDRMFWSLKRTGKLANLAGLIICGFKTKADDAGQDFGRTIYEIVNEKVKEYSYPVAFNFPVGHQKYNMPLKYGAEHTLEVGIDGTKLKPL